MINIKKKVYIKISVLVIFFSLFLSQLPFLKFENASENHIDNQYKDNQDLTELKINADFDWVIIPTVSNKYFSPDSSPDISDSIIYSFAVNQEKNYTLNISAYYDPIDNFIGTPGSEGINYGAAYLMPNGTWLVVGLEFDSEQFENWLVLGIGTNTSNFKWQRVGQVNLTTSIAIAGGEGGRIRIVFFEEIGVNTLFSGINYFASDNWGDKWRSGTLMNYTAFSDINIYGISITEYKGNYTCAWGASLDESLLNCTIVATEETNGSWAQASNLTAFGGPSNPRIGCRFPQLFHNRTNNNGTLMLAYEYYLHPEIEDETQCMDIIQLGNGLDALATGNWSISFEVNDFSYETPLVYCTKDYLTETFYFLDISRYGQIGKGIRNATWGNPDVVSQFVDLFQTQTENNQRFNIYGRNGPKCFSMYAKSDNGFRVPGILDCKTPFNVRKIVGETQPSETKSHVFNGRDDNGNSREARAYSFNIFVSSEIGGTNNLIVYIDDVPVSAIFSPSDNYISPFSSQGSSDSFYCDAISNKEGIATLNLKTVQPTFAQNNIKKDIIIAQNSILCGDGVNLFLFFINWDEQIKNLMLVKSIDGGLSWTSDPKLIYSSMDAGFKPLTAILTGSELYLWCSGNDNYLFISTDFGESWIKQKQKIMVDSITNDLSCWRYDKGKATEIQINRSADFGYTWESFLTINNEKASNYELQDVAYDPISGNYSFLFARTKAYEVLFLTAINNGTKFSTSNNTITNGNELDGYYIDKVEIDVRWIDENSTEWIITSCSINDYNMSTKLSDLSYCVTNGSLIFSPWQNFLDAQSNPIPTYVSLDEEKCWNIIFPKYGEPCHVTGLIGFSQYAESLKITSSSKLIYSTSKELEEYSPGLFHAPLYFYGIKGNGEICWDTQNLTWTYEVADRAGFKVMESGTLFIDNQYPSLVLGPILKPANPYPTNDVNISILIYEENPSNVTLRYRIPEIPGWNNISMIIDDSNAPTLNYTATIPEQAQNIDSIEWYILVEDLCSNNLEILDNEQYYSYARPVYEYIKESGVLTPTLYDDWTWSYAITSGNEHITDVFMRMEFDNNASQLEYNVNPIGEFNNIFSIKINHTLLHSNAIYKFMYRTDLGQLYTIEAIALKIPNIRIEEEEEPPNTIDLNELDRLTVSFVIPEYIEYVSYVYIKYKFDDGEGTQKENLEVTGSLFQYIFEDIPIDATILTYKIIVVDIYGREIELDEEYTIDILPKLPSIEMNPGEQLIVSIIALSIGIICGLLYTAIMRSKGSEHSLQEEILKSSKNFSQKIEIINNETKEKNNKDKIIELIKLNRAQIIGLISLGLIICAVLAILLVLIFQIAEIAMLLLTGAFVLAITLWVLLSAYTADNILRSKEIKSMRKEKILLISISLMIYTMLFLIFFIGNTITWWRVRVNEQSYNIAGLIVPTALTTVTTTFFSSIFLLTWSTFKQISDKAEELKQAEDNNNNPLEVIQRRKKAISTIVNNVGTKGIIFTAIIVVVIVFASDLNLYAGQAILLVILFVIGAISTLVIMAYLQMKKEKPMEKVVLDHLIRCPYCNSETALGGNFCEKCGEKLLLGDRSSTGFVCDNCNLVATSGSKHCRYCGTNLEEIDSKSNSEVNKNT